MCVGAGYMEMVECLDWKGIASCRDCERIYEVVE